MLGSADPKAAESIALTAGIVAAYVTHNSVQQADLPSFIASVHAALLTLEKAPQAEAKKPTPLLPIRKTITADYLISLEDGRRYRSLKRHLSGRGLTPQQYREKWGLPPDYPMVAANHSARRSELAKATGLGRKGRKPPQAAAAKRGRR